MREKRPNLEFSGPYFPAFGRNTERYLSRISPYSVRMRENTDQKISECGLFSRSERDAPMSDFNIQIVDYNTTSIVFR